MMLPIQLLSHDYSNRLVSYADVNEYIVPWIPGHNTMQYTIAEQRLMYLLD
jgi:hypothetical protein